MTQYPLWKYILIALVLILGVIYAVPNSFGDDPAVQISPLRGQEFTAEHLKSLEETLKAAQIQYFAAEQTKEGGLIRFSDTDTQLKAQQLVKEKLGSGFVVALNLVPATPDWLRALGGSPMKLGLDLRGGVHFLMQVDIDAALAERLEQYTIDFRESLRTARLHYVAVQKDMGSLTVRFRDANTLDKAESFLHKQYPELTLEKAEQTSSLVARLPEPLLKEIRDYAISQNVITLRNRINELGVAESLVQRQGIDKIVVEIPGIQDTAQAKRILGAAATVKFYGVDETRDPAAIDGRVPIGDKLVQWRNGQPVLLKKRVVLSGEHIVGAVSGPDESGMPAVNITLDGVGGKKFSDFTGKHIGRLMAVVFEEIKEGHLTEEVISVATIKGQLARRFQITGLDSFDEARELALFLRAGSLAAPMKLVEERTVGPSLGKDNIDKGLLSSQMAFLVVLVFMVLRYKLFGLVAGAALFANVILLVAVMSLLPGAALTLPGIAGIVLTMGMAVDANVLIYERIREELRNGMSPKASIEAGFEKAFGTILDANLTTLIAGLVLFAMGTGPVKGFAVTLSLGIFTSMFTAVTVSRALVYAFFVRKKMSRLYV